MDKIYKESPTRLSRRVVGQIAASLAILPLSRVRDPRPGKTQWPLVTLLKVLLLGMAAGAKGLQDVEMLTYFLSPAARKLLGIRKRVPDTTLRDTLMKLDVHDLRHQNHRFMHAAERKKQVRHTLPLRVVSLDGKHTSSWLCDRPDAAVKFGQRQDGRAIVRTITSCLVSADGRPCLDAFPIPPETNEVGIFPTAACALLDAYPNRFDVLMYDAGACSLDNATWVKNRGLDYVFCLTENQPTLLAEGQRVLAARTDSDGDDTRLEGSNVVVRRVFFHDLQGLTDGSEGGFLDWTHLRTIVRVEVRRFDKVLATESIENRYYLTSLAHDKLSPKDWNEMIRRRWSVENENHGTWDRVMREDTRPWIMDPAGMVKVQLLRRIAYNILTFFRSVTLRSEARRAMPWTMLMYFVQHAFSSWAVEVFQGIRKRAQATL